MQRGALREILESEITDEEKVSQLLILADDVEGQLDDANSDWPLLYEIISDDEDGSDAGPWQAAFSALVTLAGAKISEKSR